MVEVQFSFSQRSGRPVGVAGKILSSLFMLVFLAGGIFLTTWIGKDIVKSVRTRSWQSTACTITSSRITEKSPYKYEVAYTYLFGGKPFTGHQIYTGYNGTDAYYDAQKLLDEFPKGQPTFCRVNPANPAEAVLQIRSIWYTLMILFPLVFVAVGGGGIYFVWRPYRPSLEKSRQSKLIISIVGSAFFLAGLGMLGGFIHLRLRSSAAQSWPTVPCTVVTSDVSSHSDNSDDGGTTYGVNVLFRYSFAGRKYASSRFRLTSVSTSDYAAQKQIADDLLRSPNRSCYVNPTDPADAVLDRQPGAAQLLFGIMSAVFTAVGAGLLIAALRMRKQTVFPEPGSVPR